MDVSNNTDLEQLVCEGNPLTRLDVSNNIALTWLVCSNNQITSLQVENNIALTNLYCGDNPLTSLDVSKNTNLHILYIENMPNLTEVYLWTVPFQTTNIEIDTTGSPNVYFTNDCSVTEIYNNKENSTINIYPNPSDDIIKIEIENQINATIKIYNVSGGLVFRKAVDSKTEKINVSDFLEGIYIINVKQDNIVNVGKVVVR